ncbi:MAG: ATPase BadF/BadG/BcrA/BcrD type [Herbinix sp.]|jgi:glucosamine kinase|nr:ATPase BadF/BadG/BcrA/BcrD type [Herbinix sp.]
MSDKVVLGIDGGGTYTRAAITDMDGNLLSYVEWKGGAFIYKDSNAKENVFNAVHVAVKKANCELNNIVSVVAGVAGYDNESDLEWVRELTNIDGLKCASQHVNDAVIAHKGALISKPGIIAISGTGSVIYGITDTEKHIRNYDFHYYADTAARCLSYNSVHKIIAGETDQTDNEFVNKVYKYFSVNDLSDLVKFGSEGFIHDYKQRDKLFGDMASIVTDAALEGSHLAINICSQAASELVTGIRLIGANFKADTIPVALIGSVANSRFIKNTIHNTLSQKNNKKYLMKEPVLPAVLGAIILALQLNKIDINKQILNNLIKSTEIITNQ